MYLLYKVHILNQNVHSNVIDKTENFKILEYFVDKPNINNKHTYDKLNVPDPKYLDLYM